MSQVERVLAVQNELGEGPVWNVEEQALYWVDILEGHLHRLHPASGRREFFDAGLAVGALAFRASGGLVLATENGFAFWDPRNQQLQVVADPEADRPDSRFNDGAVDRQGRFWAGTMGEGPTSALYRLDPDGSVHTMETGITISNGIGWSPDNRTMYYTDTPLRVIYAYDFDPASGAIENRRSFVHVPDGDGLPDGLTVDSEGFVWSACWDGWKVIRYDPDGGVERKVELPVQRPTSCTFGGPDLDELYITSAWIALSAAERKDQPLAGDLFRLKTNVRGLEEPRFLG
jgi:L-arabinonolactonase